MQIYKETNNKKIQIKYPLDIGQSYYMYTIPELIINMVLGQHRCCAMEKKEVENQALNIIINIIGVHITCLTYIKIYRINK